jgi:hypothetical protein
MPRVTFAPLPTTYAPKDVEAMLESDWLDLAELYCELWPRSPLPRETIERWHPLLADLERREVASAFRLLALEPGRRFAPEVGEIRAAVLPPPRRWEDALSELREVARTYGAYRRPPQFADPVLERLVEERTWRDVCLASVDDTTYRAQFRDAYTALQRARELAIARHASGLPNPSHRTPLPAARPPLAIEEGEPSRTLTVGEAIERMHESLGVADDLDVDLSCDDPSIPSSPRERRARAARARRKVAEARERWAREEGAR